MKPSQHKAHRLPVSLSKLLLSLCLPSTFLFWWFLSQFLSLYSGVWFCFFFSSAALHCFLVLADCVQYKALVILMFKSEWLPVDHEGHRFTNNSKKDQIKWKVIWDETSLKSWSIFPTLNSWEIHLLYSVLIRGEQKQHDIPVRAGNRWRLGDLSQDAADITEKTHGPCILFDLTTIISESSCNLFWHTLFLKKKLFINTLLRGCHAIHFHTLILIIFLTVMIFFY